MIRKPFRLWISVSLFVAAVLTVPLVDQLRRRSIFPPGTPTELMVLLSRDAPLLYVVPVSENRPENGIHICTQPRRRDNLVLFRGNPIEIGTARLSRWQGVVYCERVGEKGFIPEEEFEGWGEYGMQIGSLVYFGDPALLQRIRKLILPSAVAEKSLGNNRFTLDN